jgi:hypothetical protein
MRVCCPDCKKRFDVGHVAVLKEAERLKAERAARLAGANALDPADAEAARQREEAIARRKRGA